MSNKPTADQLSQIVTSLKKHLDGLWEFVEYVEPHLDRGHQDVIKSKAKNLAPLVLIMNNGNPGDFPLNDDVRKRMLAACGDSVEVVSSEKDGVVKDEVKINPKKSVEVVEAMEAVRKSMERSGQLYESSLVSLVSGIEVFFAKILHAHFSLGASIPGSKDKFFSFDDLREINNVAEARELILESKIEDVLRGSFKSWIDYLRQPVGLSMGYLECHLDAVTEMCLRRNILVHNAGFINKIYLSKAPAGFKSDQKLGEKISVSKKYLKDCIARVELCCSLMGFEFWKRMESVSEARASLLAKYAFENVCAARYELSEGFSRFLRADKDQADEYIVLGDLNYWLSFKKTGRWDIVKSEVNNADFSSKSLRLRVALAALKDDADSFFALAPIARKNGDIESSEYDTFPIFDGLRADPRYTKLLTRKTKAKVEGGGAKRSSRGKQKRGASQNSPKSKRV